MRTSSLRDAVQALISADDASAILRDSAEQVDRFVETDVLRPVAASGAIAVFSRDEVDRLFAAV